MVGEQMLVAEDSWSCELSALANMCFAVIHMARTYAAPALANGAVLSHLRTVKWVMSPILS